MSKITFRAYEIYNNANEFQGVLMAQSGIGYSNWFIGRTKRHLIDYQLTTVLKETTQEQITNAGFKVVFNPSFNFENLK